MTPNAGSKVTIENYVMWACRRSGGTQWMPLGLSFLKVSKGVIIQSKLVYTCIEG